MNIHSGSHANIAHLPPTSHKRCSSLDQTFPLPPARTRRRRPSSDASDEHQVQKHKREVLQKQRSGSVPPPGDKSDEETSSQSSQSGIKANRPLFRQRTLFTPPPFRTSNSDSTTPKISRGSSDVDLSFSNTPFGSSGQAKHHKGNWKSRANRWLWGGSKKEKESEDGGSRDSSTSSNKSVTLRHKKRRSPHTSCPDISSASSDSSRSNSPTGLRASFNSLFHKPRHRTNSFSLEDNNKVLERCSPVEARRFRNLHSTPPNDRFCFIPDHGDNCGFDCADHKYVSKNSNMNPGSASIDIPLEEDSPFVSGEYIRYSPPSLPPNLDVCNYPNCHECSQHAYISR